MYIHMYMYVYTRLGVEGPRLLSQLSSAFLKLAALFTFSLYLLTHAHAHGHSLLRYLHPAIFFASVY